MRQLPLERPSEMVKSAKVVSSSNGSGEAHCGKAEPCSHILANLCDDVTQRKLGSIPIGCDLQKQMMGIAVGSGALRH
jgi:hypothetical protein